MKHQLLAWRVSDIWVQRCSSDEMVHMAAGMQASEFPARFLCCGQAATSSSQPLVSTYLQAFYGDERFFSRRSTWAAVAGVVHWSTTGVHGRQIKYLDSLGLSITYSAERQLLISALNEKHKNQTTNRRESFLSFLQQFSSRKWWTLRCLFNSRQTRSLFHITEGNLVTERPGKVKMNVTFHFKRKQFIYWVMNHQVYISFSKPKKTQIMHSTETEK